MKKSLKKVVSLTLVIAVLIASMMVGSVAAATNPLQDVLLSALGLDYTGRTSFNAALNLAETDVDGAAASLHTLFPQMSVADAKLALESYVALKDDQKALIQANVLIFSLNLQSYDGRGFNTIIDKVNYEITGEETDNTGISLIIQLLEYLNAASENGAYATDLSSDTSKIVFKYNPADSVVALAILSFNELIGAMETLNNKIASSTGDTSFDKLLNYTAGVVNSAPATEVAALKTYLNTLNDDYYIPYSASSGVVVTPVEDPVSDDVEDLLGDLNNSDTSSGTVQNDLKKAAEAAMEKEIAKVGTTTVTANVNGTTATITADQIKVEDVIAKADAVLAKAEELAKLAGDAKVNIEKKVVIEVDAGNAANINVALPAELLTKVQEKGIQKVEIVSGDIKLNVAPDFVKDAKDSKSVSFGISKVTVTDDLKAKMSDAQKALLTSNATVLDFNAAVVTADGTEKKITNFDKPVVIKVKYDLKTGESKDKITVLYLADDGSVKNMVGRYNEATGEVIFETKHFSTYVVKNNVKTFSDVSKDAWYRSQAESIAAKGIVEGRPGNTFDPNANVTRAEFVTMLVKAKGVYDETATVDFTDVSENAWYYTYVASAVNAGITSGTGEGKFSPDSLITREQMAVMLANALDETVTGASKYLTFTDSSKISNYAKNAVALCVKNELIVGNNNKVDPQGKATRGMAAVVVYKYFNFVY